MSENGRQVRKFPGEWVKVGRQQAEGWIATNQADRPDNPDLRVLPGCGAVLLGQNAASLSGLDTIRSQEPILEFAYTLLWSGINFRGDLLATGFSQLKTWEMAAPLFSYKELACDLGTERDRELTAAVVHDLRVPAYDVRLIFMRRCDVTRRLLALWAEEEGDRVLAFLRAIYQVKPLILALPTTWLLT